MRIDPISIQRVDEAVGAVLRAQERRWGAPLINHLVIARVPVIFKAVRAMWSALSAAGKIDESLQALVNRRVAALNHCEF